MKPRPVIARQPAQPGLLLYHILIHILAGEFYHRLPRDRFRIGRPTLFSRGPDMSGVTDRTSD